MLRKLNLVFVYISICKSHTFITLFQGWFFKPMSMLILEFKLKIYLNFNIAQRVNDNLLFKLTLKQFSLISFSFTKQNGCQ